MSSAPPPFSPSAFGLAVQELAPILVDLIFNFEIKLTMTALFLRPSAMAIRNRRLGMLGAAFAAPPGNGWPMTGFGRRRIFVCRDRTGAVEPVAR